MAKEFTWIQPGYKLVKFNFEWNVQVPFLPPDEVDDKDAETVECPLFSPEEYPDIKWYLYLANHGTEIAICLKLFFDKISCFFDDIADKIDTFDGKYFYTENILVKISLLNRERRKVLQQMLPSSLQNEHLEFSLNKEEINQSKCQQADGSYTFCCKILFHVKKPVSSAYPPGVAINCSGGLSDQLEKLFEKMLFSDVVFNIGGREFPAHKSILAARSEFFAAMFQDPTKENLKHQIEIENDPEIFEELLRFMYTGRLDTSTMETMAVGLLVAADKYLLNDLKSECENYFVREMSSENCVELILHGDLLNPAEHLKKSIKEAAKFFRLFPSHVMETDKWEEMEKENPQMLFKVQKILFSEKV
jgi:speckle-type POZ protein